MEYSNAHHYDMNHFGLQYLVFPPDRRVPWQEATPPNLTGGIDEQGSGQLRNCAYCGSLHPEDVATAIRAGARGEWADWKYGWPHKAYFDNIPNPHAGMLEIRSMQSYPPPEDEAHQWRRVQNGFNSRTGGPEYWWAEAGRPASATTSGKFYSVHLLDATPEDKALIESHLGITFDFSDDGKTVSWKRVGAPSK